MDTIVLDGEAMTSRDAAHDHLALRLGLPDHYGRNLDALYDCLTERSSDTRLALRHVPAMEAALGDYAKALLDTLLDAAGDNPRLQVEILLGDGKPCNI